MTGDGAGLLLVDKPPDVTSHEAVQRARRGLGIRRIGHTGTLDPFATGLLLLCVGPFTRAAEYFHLPSKTYEAALRLGVETDTHDPTGRVTARSERWRELTEERVAEALDAHRGPGRQVPPAYSAKRVGGERAHRSARAGARVELPPTEVVIHELAVQAFDPPTLRIRTRVSTGTYVRALARDLGRDLGCGAHLAALRRTRIGPFHVREAVELARVAGPGGAGPAGTHGGTGGADAPLPPGAWRSPAEALGWLPVRPLDAEEAEAVRHGRRIPAGAIARAAVPELAEPELAEPPGELDLPVALLREGRLVAVAERADGALQPRKVFESG